MKPYLLLNLELMAEEYQQLEEELSWGLPIENSAIRAEHAAIKAKVDSGLSVEAAIIKYILETVGFWGG